MRLLNSLVVLCAVFAGCRPRPDIDPIERVARERGLRNVADTGAFQGPAREGRDSIAAELKRRGERLADWYTVAAVFGDSLVVFHVWDRAALAPEARDWRGGPPGSRSFNADYDLRHHRIIAWLLWQ
ncbi:MAG TPA: hypothetical protein VF761_00510 [Gemmatimonadaceae bacterium]